MYRDHRCFQKPTDLDCHIWRYMSFASLMQMLDTSTLHFTRTDTFQDRFEGGLTRPNAKALDAIYERIRERMPHHAEAARQGREHRSLQTQRIRRQTAVNCWCMNEHESAAMWKLYTRGDGVAVRSSVRGLIESFDEDNREILIWVGLVQYIDYERDIIPQDNAFYPIMHKRLSFAYESEIRAVASQCEVDTTDGSVHIVPQDFPAEGTDVRVNLQALVDCVFVSPESPEWYASLVQRLVEPRGFDVHRSDLDSEPIW